MLTRDHSNIVEYDGQEFTVDTRYKTCLRFLQLLEDDLFMNYEKIIVGIEVLLGEEREESVEWQYGLFMAILKQIFEVDEGSKSDEEKAYDYEQDGELIYASFLQEYNIDLIEQDIPWHKFTYLIRQLSDDSPFKTALKYRLMKIPARNKYNKDQVDYYKKMKEFYRLDKKELKAPKNNDSKVADALKAFKR